MGFSINSIGGQNSSQKLMPPKEDIMAKLSALGIPSDIIQQGPDSVKKYADENGITLPAPPQKPDNIFANNQETNAQTEVNDKQPPAELKQKLIALGIPEATIAQGREAVMQYAQQNNITLPAPPEGNGNRLSISA